MINPADICRLMALLFLLSALALAIPDVNASTCRNINVAHRFATKQGYPHGRPGYIIDHVCALAQGGIDATSNMQYQTLTDSKIKDRIENTPLGKLKWCTPLNSTPTRQVFNCN